MFIAAFPKRLAPLFQSFFSRPQDGLTTVHNHDFLSEPGFRSAYARGVQAVGTDYHWHWRVHIGLWVAFSVSKLNGDFVECGVNRGFLSSAIMEDLEWDRLDKTFYLLDTFAGVDEEMITAVEQSKRKFSGTGEIWNQSQARWCCSTITPISALNLKGRQWMFWLKNAKFESFHFQLVRDCSSSHPQGHLDKL